MNDIYIDVRCILRFRSKNEKENKMRTRDTDVSEVVPTEHDSVDRRKDFCSKRIEDTVGFRNSNERHEL